MTGKKSILLVEDNPDDEKLTVRALQKSNILNEIIVVRDGAEALDYIFRKGKYEARDVSQKPQIILLDLNLPKISGIDVLKKIRENKETKLLPVIILTSSDEERDIIDSYNLGANSYIKKPVDFDSFVKAVQQLELYWLVLNEQPSL